MRICEIPKVVLYSQDCPDIPKEIRNLSDFRNTCFYFFLNSPQTPIDALRMLCEQQGFMPEIKLAANLSTMLSLVESGKGAAILDLWHQLIYMDGFRHFELADTYNITLVYRRSGEFPEAVEAIRRALCRHLQPPSSVRSAAFLSMPAAYPVNDPSEPTTL